VSLPDISGDDLAMAHLRCDFFSEALSLSTSMTVLLPQRATTQIGMAGRAGDDAPPVLYLLHGLSDDDTIWLRRTCIERYVAPLGLAVVMPQVHRSFYTDEVYGGRYWTFLSQELPDLVGSLFRVSQRREDTFVAGLSMGGYGALKWALRQPERFAAAASLSGVLNLTRMRSERVRPEDPRLFERVFGDSPISGGPDDLLTLLEQLNEREVPPMYLCCGTEDHLIEDNTLFQQACGDAGVPVTAEFSAGEHEWGYWDTKIQDVLAWLPLADRGARLTWTDGPSHSSSTAV
jgi:putative tributyrin esterase